jgi:hypothetical protein
LLVSRYVPAGSASFASAPLVSEYPYLLSVLLCAIRGCEPAPASVALRKGLGA